MTSPTALQADCKANQNRRKVQKRVRLTHHSWFLLGFLAIAALAAGCSRASSPSPVPAAEPEKVAQNVEFQTGTQCDPGKEWWREQKTPVRGGTFEMPATSPHLDPVTGTALTVRAIPEVYDTL